MPILTIISALQAAVKYGPDAYAAAQRVAAIIRNSGHPDLTPADIAQLEAFGAKSSAEYLADAEAAAGHAAPAAPSA